MSVANPYQQYQQNAVQSADPGDLVVMLYDGLVRFLKLAVKSLEENDKGAANTALIKSQDIVSYLSETLDMRFEISRNLAALYDFMSRQLVSANMKKEVQLVEEVLGLAQELRDTWRQAAQMAKTQR